MTQQSDLKVAEMLSKAKTYENMMWIGLIFFPAAILFYSMCRNQLREVNELYELSDHAQVRYDEIKKSARNIFITLTGLAILAAIIVVITYNNQMKKVENLQQKVYNSLPSKYRY